MSYRRKPAEPSELVRRRAAGDARPAGSGRVYYGAIRLVKRTQAVTADPQVQSGGAFDNSRSGGHDGCTRVALSVEAGSATAAG
jgi:hypothetical protein